MPTGGGRSGPGSAAGRCRRAPAGRRGAAAGRACSRSCRPSPRPGGRRARPPRRGSQPGRTRSSRGASSAGRGESAEGRVAGPVHRRGPSCRHRRRRRPGCVAPGDGSAVRHGGRSRAAVTSASGHGCGPAGVTAGRRTSLTGVHRGLQRAAHLLARLVGGGLGLRLALAGHVRSFQGADHRDTVALRAPGAPARRDH
ncbi:hypothetical protein MicB006_1503 [Micromonospora sp. B006]|nr:hypothetical protein MicB006_1503 [Micromonospora sp. B006]